MTLTNAYATMADLKPGDIIERGQQPAAGRPATPEPSASLPTTPPPAPPAPVPTRGIVIRCCTCLSLITS